MCYPQIIYGLLITNLNKCITFIPISGLRVLSLNLDTFMDNQNPTKLLTKTNYHEKKLPFTSCYRICNCSIN